MILKPRLFRKPRKGHWATKGLVLFPLMNEGSGNIVNDLSGNRKHLTLGGTSPTWGTGQFGPCLTLDTNEYAEINSSFVTGYPFTIWIWFKTSASGDNMFMISLADASESVINYGIRIDGGTGILEGWARNITIYKNASIGVVNDGNWHLATLVFVSSTQRDLYLDAIYQSTGTDSVTWNTDIDRLSVGRLGRLAPTAYWNGSLDIPGIANRALSASEIALLYLNPFIMFERDPIELWVGATSVGAPATIVPQIQYLRNMGVVA